jgi:ABC-type transporter MlaC component
MVFAISSPQELTRQFYQNLTKSHQVTQQNLDRAFQVFQDAFYFDKFYERCVQDIARQMTAVESEEFRQKFAALFFENFHYRVKSFVKKRLYQPSYEAIPAPNGLVAVLIHGQDANQQSHTLKFTVAPENKNHFIVDLDFDGANLSRQYRGSFNKIFRERGGTPALLEHLEKANQKLKEKNKPRNF